MKMTILLRLLVGIAVFVNVACGDDDPKTEQNTDSSDLDSATLDAGETGTGSTDGEPTCDNLSLCAESNGEYTCPAEVAEGRSCKTLEACEKTVVCASDEEACLVECNRIDCAILDTDPQWVQCPDS